MWRLFDPHPSLTELDVSRRSALLGRSLVVITMLFACVDTVLAAIVPAHQPPWVGYVVLLGTIALNRAGHFAAAAVIATLLFSVVAFGLVYTGSTFSPTLTLSYLALGPMLGSFFLPVRGVLALTLFNLLGIAVLTLVAPSLNRDLALVIGPFSTTAMLGVLAAFYMHHRNVTEADRATLLQRNEERMREAQKLEALGRFGGGIAHDFNNVLMVIMGNAALLKLRLAAPELKQIEDAAQSAAALTRQLLAFSRTAVLEPRVLDLGELVRSATAMVARLIGEDVSIECKVDAEPWPTRLDESLIVQVLLNLATNARDAMPNGGTLEFTVANEALGPSDPRLRSNPAGDYVRLSVRDDGAGMEEATRQRVFEPFFTTKARGKGTGLGLAMVFGTVSQSGGFIEVTSAFGRGTQFDLYFPRTDKATPSHRPPSPAVTPGQETLLLVEDDEAVRKVISQMLMGSGYRVISAGTPAEARAHWSEHASQIALIITDEVMPGGRGTDLVAELRSERPALKALSMSGYAEPEGAAAATDLAITRISKPVAREELLRRVRALLDG